MSLPTASPATPIANGYDLVGRYRQDEINGFHPELIDRLFDLADLAGARTVLDAMGGDGNLTARLFDYCTRKRIAPPRVTLLEHSRVQCEFARERLAGLPVTVVWGDALAMAALENGAPLPDGGFDRVLIKSANHEIPLEDQATLYRAIRRVLAPGGRFVNLGFLFDETVERDEFREIARVKDALAGLTSQAQRRHFLTRDEFYPRLEEAGFAAPHCGMHFEYRIHSASVEQEYFSRPDVAHLTPELQVPQVKAFTLRRRGRVRFEQAACLMSMPGEITVARPAPPAVPPPEERDDAVRDAVRDLPASTAFFDAVAALLPASGRVLELGCGDAHVLDRLPAAVAYAGLDAAPERIERARRRHAARAGVSFACVALDEVAPDEAAYDAVVALNTHQLPGVDGARLLRRALAALRPGGRLVVFWPSSPQSLDRAVAAAQAAGATLPAARLREGFARYLGAGDNGWSTEGLVQLLPRLGPCEIENLDPRVFDGAGVLAAVRKLAPPPDPGLVVDPRQVRVEELFQRSLCAHLPPDRFTKLQHTSVLVAGLGGGSNIAELLARKGVGRLLIADHDRYEPHNVRQRGSLASTFGREKVAVMHERLLDVNPALEVVPVAEGVTVENVPALVRHADYVIDMIDFHGFREKIALYREARAHGKTVLTAPSVVNGAVLYVFAPDGPTFERFFGLEEGAPVHELGVRLLRRLIPHFPPEAPEDVYRAAARGERTIPLDAVGVDQAAVLTAAALENLVLGRRERVVFAPRGIQVDLSDPAFLVRVVDFSGGVTC